MVPHEQLLVQRYRDKPFVLLGVNIDENRGAALKMIAARGISWRNWRACGEGNSIQKHWPVAFLPTSYVIDGKGVVRYTGVSGAHLENCIETLLAEAESRR